MKAEDAKKLKQLEKQSLALKKLLAEAELEQAVLKGLVEGKFLSPTIRRRAVIQVINTFDVSEQLACRLVGLSRSAFRLPLKAGTSEDPDLALRSWLRDYARRHARWGYRRAYVDARNNGWQVNHKKLQRLWAEEGLRVVVKRRRKRVGSSTVEALTAQKAGDVRSVDFQFDSTIMGRPVKILSIVDELTRECLGGIVD